MNIIVIGCGRVGAELAFRLYRRGHDVTVVDEAEIAFESLHPDFRGRTVKGDLLAQDTLHRAGIEHAHALAAVTPTDAVNAVVAWVALERYKVQQVVVRNYDPRQHPMLEAFGLQVVSPSSWGAQRIEEMLSDAMIPAVFSAGNGEVEIYEFAIPPAWDGRQVGEVIPSSSLPVALTRIGRALLPTREMRLQTGDIMHVSSTRQGIAALRATLPAVADTQSQEA